jgi:hypothetical protein
VAFASNLAFAESIFLRVSAMEVSDFLSKRSDSFLMESLSSADCLITWSLVDSNNLAVTSWIYETLLWIIFMVTPFFVLIKTVVSSLLACTLASIFRLR